MNSSNNGCPVDNSVTLICNFFRYPDIINVYKRTKQRPTSATKRFLYVFMKQPAVYNAISFVRDDIKTAEASTTFLCLWCIRGPLGFCYRAPVPKKGSPVISGPVGIFKQRSSVKRFSRMRNIPFDHQY